MLPKSLLVEGTAVYGWVKNTYILTTHSAFSHVVVMLQAIKSQCTTRTERSATKKLSLRIGKVNTHPQSGIAQISSKHCESVSSNP
jgi:hypothetical protein